MARRRMGVLWPLVRHSNGLAPIYAALFTLLLASLVGFAVAFWPSPAAPFTPGPSRSEASADGQSAEATPGVMTQAREPRRRARWM